jgi:type IV pilus assembly protein PilX
MNPPGRLQAQRMAHRQHGVVLILALIMLIVISLLAAFSVRNATTTEAIAGNVRTAETANQAAEIALRYCEAAVVQSETGSGSLTLPLPTIHDYVDPPKWKAMANWDTVAAPPLQYLIPESTVNVSSAQVTFKRMPECMVERLPVRSGAAYSTSSTFIITARGFGPEVAAGTGRPSGAEVWLQSTIELK